LWVKPTTFTSTPNIIGVRSGENGWGMRMDADGRVRMFAGTSSYESTVGGPALTLNSWNHIRAFFNGASSKLYIKLLYLILFPD